MSEQIKVPTPVEVLAAWLNAKRKTTEKNVRSPMGRALDAFVMAHIGHDMAMLDESNWAELVSEFCTAAGRVHWKAKSAKVNDELRVSSLASDKGLADPGSTADWNKESGLPLLAILSGLGRKIAKLEQAGFTFTRIAPDFEKLEKVRAKCLSSKRFMKETLAEEEE